MTEKWRERLITVIFTIGLFFIFTSFDSGALVLKKLFSIIAPAIYGGLVALVLSVFISGTNNIFKKIDKKNKINPTVRNVLSIITTLLIIVFVIYLLIIIVVPRFSEGIQSIINTIEKNWDKIVAFCNNLGIDASRIQSIVKQLDTASVIGFAGENVKNILKTVIITASSIYVVLFTAIISIVFCIYILYGQDKLASQCSRVIKAYLPKKAAEKTISTAILFWMTFKNFLCRQCLEALILGFLLTIGMLVFGIPYALIIGCLTAILALIPYVGAFISCAIAIFLILLVEPSKLLVFIVLFLVIQQIEGNLIYPHIVGKSVGLPAIWTLMAVYAGGQLFGILGMLLFVPIVSVIYTLIKEDVTKRIKKKSYQ